jgi:hypothetical protein
VQDSRGVTINLCYIVTVFIGDNVPPISQIANRTSLHWRIIRYCSAACLFFLTPIAAPSQSATVSTDSVALAKTAVAPIVCLVRDAATGTQKSRFQIVGTAFMIDKNGTFITASHVIAAILASPLKEVCLPAITFPPGGWKRDPNQSVEWFAFNSADCQANPAFDVAVCKTTDEMVSKHPEIDFAVTAISTERPPDGTPVFFTGFPLQATDPITSIGAIAGYSAGDAYSTVLIDKNAWPGASGSPIFLINGKTIIGMVTRTGTGDASGLSFGIAGERIVVVLADAKKNWEKEQQKASELPNPPATQH